MKGEWVNNTKGEVTVVFVHGILSSGEACWLHENGSYWPELLKNQTELGPLGIYVYTYQTDIFSGSYRLSDIVDDLKERMKLDKLYDSKRIIFVCHSMGGIVVRKFIVERIIDLIETNIEIGLFMVASPSLGSYYANLFSAFAKVLGNSQVQTMRFNEDNSWLRDLDKEFQNLKESGKLKIKGKELIEDKFLVLKKIWRKQVVEPFSGARYFGEPYKVPHSDHFSIAKPSDKEAIQHLLLCQFIEDKSKLSEGNRKTEDKRLNELTTSHSLLAAVLDEVEGLGITDATVSAILSSNISKSDLSDFWCLIAKQVEDWKLYDVAVHVLSIIDKFNTGHDVIDYCLEEGRLSSEQRESLGMSMKNVTSKDAIIWCHHQLTTRIKSDVYYNWFLHKHADVVTNVCYDQMAAYLLSPNRGPANCNVDTFYDVIKKLADPEPFIIRWIDWVRTGRFDGNGGEGDEFAYYLYTIFNEIIEESDAKFDPILKETLNRVYLLLTSDENVCKGLYHLVAMLSVQYKGAYYVLENILEMVNTARLSNEVTNMYFLLKSSFQLLTRLNKDPENRVLQDAVSSKWLEITEADKITEVLTGPKRFLNG